MEDDGFFWNDDAEQTQSPLGVLSSLGLVMVGRTTISNRNYKIAAIPKELRQILTELLKKGTGYFFAF